eukprot:3293609-Prymnesium_polylepis.1
MFSWSRPNIPSTSEKTLQAWVAKLVSSSKAVCGGRGCAGVWDRYRAAYRSDGADDGSIAKIMRAALAQAGKAGLLKRHHLRTPSVYSRTSARSKPVHEAAATKYAGSSLIISGTRRSSERRVERLHEAEDLVHVLAAVVGLAVAGEAVLEVLEAGREAVDDGGAIGVRRDVEERAHLPY